MIRTQDGVTVRQDDRAFNYYDMQPGRIGTMDVMLQPDTMAGQDSSTPMEEWSNQWFDFIQDNGRTTSLDGSRICSMEYATRRGRVTP